ncbi:hypothetical protein GF386_03645 [Candidatus Pacearchaeota archaeon]|nr:hypothetical protein [Candidatus Pacearchaeota archaeon]MBD3283245.1 hypothetical protein [Candidatus Pacearchaeota archaeon]
MRRGFLLVILLLIFLSPVYGQDCMTVDEVEAETSMCLYIYDGDVFHKGDYNRPHRGHDCGTDVTSEMPSSHTSDPDTYLWPYLHSELCEEGEGENPYCEFPIPEFCDGKDNDCDGDVDEDLTLETYCGVGACSDNTGVQTCVNGEWVGDTCDPYEGATDEKCDGKIDDDCDGAVDEGCNCINNETKDCGSNIGECKKGTQTCINGQWSECENVIPPIHEICDAKDNDCDGLIDENLTRPTTCGVGVCSGNTGFETCTYGVWGDNTCYPYEGASEELCNGINDDCDGSIDEGCACLEGETQICGVDIEPCTKGIQYCGIDGKWGECTGGIQPTDEECNQIDDDCDGNVDEGLKDCSTSGDCIPNWNCTEWGPCINNKKSRLCTDLNKCKSTSRPSEIQRCFIFEIEEPENKTSGESDSESSSETQSKNKTSYPRERSDRYDDEYPDQRSATEMSKSGSSTTWMIVIAIIVLALIIAGVFILKFKKKKVIESLDKIKKGVKIDYESEFWFSESKNKILSKIGIGFPINWKGWLAWIVFILLVLSLVIYFIILYASADNIVIFTVSLGIICLLFFLLSKNTTKGSLKTQPKVSENITKKQLKINPKVHKKKSRFLSRIRPKFHNRSNYRKFKYTILLNIL